MTVATARVPSSPQILSVINKMFDSKIEYFMGLAERWLDEREYEDIADYLAAINASLPEGICAIKMTKRPFGFWFTVGSFDAVYAIEITTRMAGWRRVS